MSRDTITFTVCSLQHASVTVSVCTPHGLAVAVSVLRSTVNESPFGTMGTSPVRIVALVEGPDAPKQSSMFVYATLTVPARICVFPGARATVSLPVVASNFVFAGSKLVGHTSFVAGHDLQLIPA